MNWSVAKVSLGAKGNEPAGAHGTTVPSSALKSVVRGGPPQAL